MMAVWQPPAAPCDGCLWGRSAALLIGQPARGVDHEAGAFGGVVADGGLDLVVEDRPDQRAGELAGMDLLAIGHQRIAGEGL
jgi:hypothetical protein